MLNRNLSCLNRLADPVKGKFKILTMPTHEGYQSLFGKMRHEFYMLSGQGIKPWDFHTRQLPENHYYYNIDINNLRGAERFDIVLCQNTVQSFDIMSQISHRFGLPLVVLHHTEPPPGINNYQLQEIVQQRGDINVFITEHNKRAWHGQVQDEVIFHGIDTDNFKGYSGSQNLGMSVVNHFASRDVFCGWELWKDIVGTEGINVELVGENPGISESINDPVRLASYLSNHRYYLNTSQYSPVPMSMLEAMAVGMPVVTTAKQEIPNIIQHGYNGLISNDPSELKEFCLRLHNDWEYAKELGANARKTILERFSLQHFMNRWDEVFMESVLCLS